MYNKLSNLKSMLKAITGFEKESKFQNFDRSDNLNWINFQGITLHVNHVPLRLYNFANVFRFNKLFNFSLEFLIK